MTTTTTSAVVPCSSYLSAQATHLLYENDPDVLEEPTFWADEIEDDSDLVVWNTKFGQSPECKSYAEAMSKGQFTFSVCGGSNTAVQSAGLWDYPAQIPPGVRRYFSPAYTDGLCCGNCSLDIPEVRLYYFPGKTSSCHRNQTFINSTLPAQKLEKRIHSLVANGSTAVIDGHTLLVKRCESRNNSRIDAYYSTSPSIYLQLLGTATVNDQCTTVGPKLIDPIITLAPGQISTWKPPVNMYYDDFDNFTVGEIWYDPSGIPGTGGNAAAGFALLDIEDLACPTWGLGKSTSTDGTVVTTIGPPWLPLIRPPEEIFSLDPIWSALCTGLFTDSFGLTTLALFDPPIALTPAEFLLSTSIASPTSAPAIASADPTAVSEGAATSNDAAKPAPSPTDPAASPTGKGDPGRGSPTQSPETAPVDPTSLPSNSVAYQKDKGNPPPDPPLDPKVPSVPTGVGDPPAKSITQDPPLRDSQDPPTDPKDSIVPVPVQGESPQIQSHGLGAIIYNAFGKTGPNVDGSSTTSSPPLSIFTVGAQTFTADPTGFEVENIAATTISGTVVSLGQHETLVIGSSIISLLSLFDPSPNRAYTIAGQIFTPNPSAFSIAGTTILAGGPAATIDGTIISLGLSEALVIGSSTINLPTPTYTSGKVYTIGDQAFTPNPSAFPIAGTTISVGGQGATVNGTTISLEPSGTLVIGSSTIPLLPSQIPSDIMIDGYDVVKTHSSFVVVDGKTLSAAASGVRVSGQVVSLEAGGKMLDIGTGRFALPTGAGNGSVNVQAFTGDGRGRKGVGWLLLLVLCAAVLLLCY